MKKLNYISIITTLAVAMSIILVSCASNEAASTNNKSNVTTLPGTGIVTTTTVTGDPDTTPVTGDPDTTPAPITTGTPDIDPVPTIHDLLVEAGMPNDVYYYTVVEDALTSDEARKIADYVDKNAAAFVGRYFTMDAVSLSNIIKSFNVSVTDPSEAQAAVDALPSLQNLDVCKIDANTLETLINEAFGMNVADLVGTSVVYLEAYDAYYCSHSDMVFNCLDIISIINCADGVLVYYYDDYNGTYNAAYLAETDTSYQIKFNTKISKVGSDATYHDTLKNGEFALPDGRFPVLDPVIRYELSQFITADNSANNFVTAYILSNGNYYVVYESQNTLSSAEVNDNNGTFSIVPVE